MYREADALLFPVVEHEDQEHHKAGESPRVAANKPAAAGSHEPKQHETRQNQRSAENPLHQPPFPVPSAGECRPAQNDQQGSQVTPQRTSLALSVIRTLLVDNEMHRRRPASPEVGSEARRLKITLIVVQCSSSQEINSVRGHLHRLPESYIQVFVAGKGETIGSVLQRRIEVLSVIRDRDGSGRHCLDNVMAMRHDPAWWRDKEVCLA